jgi:SAM-dependent methyltransferase
MERADGDGVLAGDRDADRARSERTPELLAANRRNWDERVQIHVESAFYDVEGWLSKRPGPRQREIDALGDVSGLDLVHLQCHFGKDTLAWADAGATVTGLDFSDEAIRAARELAVRAGLDDRSTFVCADVFDAAATLAPATFDVVYVSLGALCWLPSVARWADQVAALARPGGRLYLHDIHPLAWSLEPDRPALAYSYFEERQPYVDDSEQTYADLARPLSSRRTYEWNHSVGEVVTALVERGMHVDRLVEHDWTVHQQFPWLVESAPGQWSAGDGYPRLPLTYTVVASRTP